MDIAVQVSIAIGVLNQKTEVVRRGKTRCGTLDSFRNNPAMKVQVSGLGILHLPAITLHHR